MPYEQIGKNEPVCIADEVPFDIPDSWEWIRLGSIVEKLTDGAHKTPKYQSDGIPFLSVKDISSGCINFDNCKYISGEEHKELYSRCNPKKGDMLLTKVGTTGIPVIVDTDIEFSLFVSVALLKYNDQRLNSKYFLYLLQSPLVQLQCTENTRGVGNKNWVMRDIANTLLAIPPYDEQDRIVKKYEAILPLLEKYKIKEQKISELQFQFPDQLKKSILQEAVMGKLVPQDENDESASVLLERIREEKQRLIAEGKIKKDKNESIIFRRDNSHYEKLNGIERCIDNEIPFDIPNNWCWCKFENLCATLTCGYASTPEYVDECKGKPFLSAKNIKPFRFIPNQHNYIKPELFEKLRQGCCPEKGDILLTRVGAGIGEAAIIDTDLEFAIYVSLTLIKLVNRDYIDANYLLFWLNSPYGIKNAKDNTLGKKASQGNLNVKNVRKYLVPIPPLNEQYRIVEQLNTVLPQCEKL